MRSELRNHSLIDFDQKGHNESLLYSDFLFDLKNYSKMPVKEIEDMSSFEEMLDEAGDKLVIVDFHARWCGPCKQIGPELNRLSNSGKYPDVVFVKVDVDLNSETAENYDINCMPTFLFFRKGKKIDHFSGANKTKLIELLDKLVKKK